MVAAARVGLMPKAGPRLKVRAQLAGLGFSLFSVAFYYPLVLLGRIVVDYDAFLYFLPQRVYLARSLLEGRLPLWNPYLFMGAPFLANPQAAVLYPPSWLFVFGTPESIFTLQLLVHTTLAAAFTYAFGRLSLSAPPLASALGGLVWGFGGFMVGQTGHLNQLSAAAWLPALLLAYDRAVALHSPRWLALAALALALQVFAGHAQQTYMTLLAFALFGLVRAPWTRLPALLGAGFVAVAIGVLGGMLAAAQILPTLELTPLSIRGSGVEWRDAVAGSLPPYHFIRALLPPYWLDVTSTEFLGYVGVVPLTLAFLSLLAVRSRFVWFGAALCLVGLFLAPGENNGYYGLLFASVPSFGTFRVPARWLFLWSFGIVTLAILAASWIASGARVELRRRDLWPRLVIVALILASGLAWQRDYGEPFDQRRTPAVWLGLAVIALAAGAVANLRRTNPSASHFDLAMAGPSAARHHKRTKLPPSLVAAGALLLVTGAELWAAADWSPARQSPPGTPFHEPSAVGWLRTNGNTSDRTLGVAQPNYIPREEGALRARYAPLGEPIVHSLLVAGKWRETLLPNTPMQYGVRGVDGYDGGVLPLQRFYQLSTLLVPDGRARPDGVLNSRLDTAPDRRLLDLLGVQHVLVDARTLPRDGYRVSEVGDIAVLSRDPPLPLSRLVYRSEVADDDAALARLDGRDFDSTQQVVLNSGPGAVALAGQTAGTGAPLTAVSPERWQGRVNAAEPGFLVQHEAWYPGWRARVDGADVPVLRADLLFRAIPIPAGEHDVEFYFVSDTFTRGLWLTALGSVIATLLLAWPTLRRSLP